MTSTTIDTNVTLDCMPEQVLTVLTESEPGITANKEEEAQDKPAPVDIPDDVRRRMIEEFIAARQARVDAGLEEPQVLRTTVKPLPSRWGSSRRSEDRKGRPRKVFDRSVTMLKLGDGTYCRAGRGRPKEGQERVKMTVAWDFRVDSGVSYRLLDSKAAVNKLERIEDDKETSKKRHEGG